MSYPLLASGWASSLDKACFWYAEAVSKIDAKQQRAEEDTEERIKNEKVSTHGARVWVALDSVRWEDVRWGLSGCQLRRWQQNDYWILGGQLKEYGQCEVVERGNDKAETQNLGENEAKHNRKRMTQYDPNRKGKMKAFTSRCHGWETINTKFFESWGIARE
ncbi:hypothetical protein B0H14DRAFT_2573226 [Mycena olivaceomarginata]|nr:hypothetical protein B0H14DRAFT_2573226 [Mycena olivaceomarginata]